MSFFFLSLSPPVFRSAASSKSLASRLRTSISSFLPRVRRLLIVLERSPALKVRISRRPVRRGDSFPQLSILYESNGAKKKKKTHLSLLFISFLSSAEIRLLAAPLSLSLSRERLGKAFSTASLEATGQTVSRELPHCFFFLALSSTLRGGARSVARGTRSVFFESTALRSVPPRPVSRSLAYTHP